MGGVVGGVGQLVEGEPTFVTGEPSLVFLRQKPDALEVVARAQGQFAIELGADKRPRLRSATGAGALVPPPPERVARLEGRGAPPRFARDVLHGRALRDAASDISAAWTRAHAESSR